MTTPAQDFMTRFMNIDPIQMAGDFPYIVEDNPGISWTNPPKFDTSKLGDHLSKIVAEMFTGLSGAPIPPNVAAELVKLAQTYGSTRIDQYRDMHDNPVNFVRYCQLRELLRDHRFLRDQCALDVLVALSDSDGAGDPWTFEMWSTYSDGAYRLKPGINGDIIPAVHRLIRCDALWTGKSREMQRVFFSSIAQMLTLLAREQGLVRETAMPRMEIMARNHQGGNHHEPQCNASFRPQELWELAGCRETDTDAHEVFITVMTNLFMVKTMHMC